MTSCYTQTVSVPLGAGYSEVQHICSTHGHRMPHNRQYGPCWQGELEVAIDVLRTQIPTPAVTQQLQNDLFAALESIRSLRNTVLREIESKLEEIKHIKAITPKPKEDRTK